MKRKVGQFELWSVLDVIVSLGGAVIRSGVAGPTLLRLILEQPCDSLFWQGLTHPQISSDHGRETFWYRTKASMREVCVIIKLSSLLTSRLRAQI